MQQFRYASRQAARIDYYGHVMWDTILRAGSHTGSASSIIYMILFFLILCGRLFANLFIHFCISTSFSTVSYFMIFWFLFFIHPPPCVVEPSSYLIYFASCRVGGMGGGEHAYRGGRICGLGSSRRRRPADGARGWPGGPISQEKAPPGTMVDDLV